MISIESAKKIGITYCADLMGRDFVKLYAGNSTTAFSESDDNVFCFLGIEDKELVLNEEERLILTNNVEQFPYRASCNVSLIDGKVKEIEYVHP